ncbi:5-formyltetrahydrofolate cyclo-ligase [Aeromicrobium sp. PE09-221]|uniref:5-formyltetrahydrofolate cyclo-ligase n=1 Tax=Aeromicrobium sp. PE09-221 TaxID=1898043 RepID=UPI000B3EA0F0|nr:5-formyltetrahydrofolate cyclo-ligase [Aeromicrobium sp. PE09-221]OUZ06596.1 5-formyltetrahydrofolate cyclo-ligase [Aeromicrobium sp. PE09-221]
MSGSAPASKPMLRREFLARRRARPAAERRASGEALALHALSQLALSRGPRVACYLPMAEEPDTRPLIEALRGRGVEVIVPVSDPATRTLDWVVVDDEPISLGAHGIAEPSGIRLGAAALGTCSAAFVPALAVDHAGHRLGRGAGYYDRALAHHAGLTCAIVFADELVPALPHEDHDVTVSLAITPAGIFRPES